MKLIERKALQLIDKYCVILEGEQSINIEEAWSEETWDKSKQCALIAVEEILVNFAWEKSAIKFWKEVKQEIEKL